MGKEKWYISIVFLALVFFSAEPQGFTDKPGIANFVYPLFHANFFHLLANSYVLYCLSKTNIRIPHIIKAYIIAVTASFFCGSVTPTCGISSVTCVLIGMLPRSYKTTAFSISYIAVGFIIPKINAPLHLVCYCYGFFEMFFLYLKHCYDDYRRLG